MNILEKIKQGIFYLDGGTGSWLQARGLKPGELPEMWNLEHPDMITQLAREYYEAGSNGVLANTFGANRFKFTGESGKPSVAKVVQAAVANTRLARDTAAGDLVQADRYIGLDVGPLGRMLEPLGELPFEEAVEAFSEIIRAGADAGADYIFIETMNDSYETKAAVVAAKESCSLPVFVSNVYDASFRLMTGGTPQVMTAMLEGLSVDAFGANCSLGPRQMEELVPHLYEISSLPLIIKPNAGLPRMEEGRTIYDVDSDEFARRMVNMVRSGARIIGGCCGTTPEHIRKMVLATRGMEALPVQERDRTVATSYSGHVLFGECPVVIGERLNPTGREKLKEALRNDDIDYVLSEGLAQQEAGAQILNVNAGLPEVDEVQLLSECVTELQSVTRLPLMLDSTNHRALERAMRLYNGKPIVNSVNGRQEVMDRVFPLVARYGGLVVCLTLDEGGIPDTGEGRLAIARKIQKEAAKYGISNKDLIFDPLALTISVDPDAGAVTLDALELIRREMKALTIMGVSNVSFGLPDRDLVTSAFLVMALEKGLSAAIINPLSPQVMNAYRSYLALRGLGGGVVGYIGYVKEGPAGSPSQAKPSVIEGQSPLALAIVRGLKEEAAAAADELLADMDPLSVIEEHIIPGLDAVGESYDKGETFLPQLLMSADAAGAAFDRIKRGAGKGGPKVVLATVEGDIHDIGKNILKVLLENYGFTVIDLGRDVPAKVIADAAEREGAGLVGLSALMTTTLRAMEEAVRLVRERVPSCRVAVGGAVLTREYADRMGADFYGPSALDTVKYAEKILKQAGMETI